MDYVLINSMEKLEKTLRYTKLFNIYKSQLSTSQREMIDMYFFMDLSITEIANERGVSRSAVEDALQKGIIRLDELELEMKILQKSENIQQKLANLREKALNITEVKELEEIEKELDYGI